MAPEIHPNALKHLSEAEVRQAWNAVAKSIQRCGTQEPPRWLMVGWLPDGREVELIAVETVSGLLLTITTSNPAFFSARTHCTEA